MVRSFAALWLLAGCPKGANRVVDLQLPEQAETRVGQEPLQVLQDGATSQDPTQRARALALLVRDQGSDPWGTAGLGDESAWVQRATIEALGALGDAPSRALLEGKVADAAADPYVRALAARRAPGPRAAEAVADALADAHEPWIVAPLALAALQLGDPAARERLGQALETGEIALETDFVRALGDSGDPALLPALQRAESRAEQELELPIAAARLRLGDAAAEQALRKAVSDPDIERRLEAIDYLFDLPHPASEALLRKASSQGPELVTWYADLALAARGAGDPGVFGRAMGEPDREVRVMAVRLIEPALRTGAGRKTDRELQQALLDALADPDATVRVAALRAVATLGLADAAPVVDGLLTDELELVRIEAAGTSLALARAAG